MLHVKQYAEFVTITCLNWKHILADNHVKDIIIQSLTYLTTTNRVRIFAFVIMPNHMHIIWQMLGDHQRKDVQRDFLKYTGQQIIRYLGRENITLLKELRVNARDRKYQVWERNSLGILLWSDHVLWQKLTYIHENPVNAGLCIHSSDYLYSSAEFYFNNCTRWSFLSHVDG